jgi:hypothetical protein
MRVAGLAIKDSAMTDTVSAPATNAGSAALASENLALYELQKPFVEPMLRLCRLTNTALDVLFYDVGALTSALFARGWSIDTRQPTNLASAPHPFQKLNLSAVTNPSGSVIVVDANLEPYVSKPYTDMKDFFDYANGLEGKGLTTLTVTGVGSSAYGSVAFAWDISKALGEPVAAIVPGYGLADVVPQALGGWFGFEMYNALQSATQRMLAQVAPSLAMIGKDLALSTPGRQMAPTGAPVFRKGSAASDDVHAILEAVPRITRLVGHSKGALAIENALRSLSDDARPISVLTFGCVIAEERAKTTYAQSLGWIDALGILNSSGHTPEFTLFAHHSTNTFIPLSMQVETSVEQRRQ